MNPLPRKIYCPANVLPEKRLVVVQVVELDQYQKGIHTADFLDLVRQVVIFAH